MGMSLRFDPPFGASIWCLHLVDSYSITTSHAIVYLSCEKEKQVGLEVDLVLLYSLAFLFISLQAWLALPVFFVFVSTALFLLFDYSFKAHR